MQYKLTRTARTELGGGKKIQMQYIISHDIGSDMPVCHPEETSGSQASQDGNQGDTVIELVMDNGEGWHFAEANVREKKGIA